MERVGACHDRIGQRAGVVALDIGRLRRSGVAGGAAGAPSGHPTRLGWSKRSWGAPRAHSTRRAVDSRAIVQVGRDLGNAIARHARGRRRSKSSAAHVAEYLDGVRQGSQMVSPAWDAMSVKSWSVVSNVRSWRTHSWARSASIVPTWSPFLRQAFRDSAASIWSVLSGVRNGSDAKRSTIASRAVGPWTCPRGAARPSSDQRSAGRRKRSSSRRRRLLGRPSPRTARMPGRTSDTTGGGE